MQMDRMTAMNDSVAVVFMAVDGLYYDQNLALFANGWMEERLRFDRPGKAEGEVEMR